MRYISVGRRALAIIIDSLIGSIWWYPLAQKIHHPDGGFEMRYNGGRGLLVALIFIAYAFAMEAAFGATIGKFLVSIRVVMEDGSRLTTSAALVRNLLRVVDGLFFYLVGAVVIWAGGPKRQRIGDRVARTVVVPAGAVFMTEPVSAPPPPPAPTVPPPPPPMP